MPQFNPSFYVSQVFWLLLSFGFLYVMMSMLICPMIEEVLKERERHIRKTVSQAEKLNREALALHQRYQAYILSAEKEKNTKIQNAYIRIQKQNNALERKNETALRRKVRLADARITKTTMALKEKSDQLSSRLAEQLVQQLKTVEEEG